MTKNQSSPEKKKNGFKSIILIAVVLIVLIGIPLLLLNYQANRSGLTIGEVVQRITRKSEPTAKSQENSKKMKQGKKLIFWINRPLEMNSKNLRSLLIFRPLI